MIVDAESVFFPIIFVALACMLIGLYKLSCSENENFHNAREAFETEIKEQLRDLLDNTAEQRKSSKVIAGVFNNKKLAIRRITDKTRASREIDFLKKTESLPHVMKTLFNFKIDGNTFIVMPQFQSLSVFLENVKLKNIKVDDMMLNSLVYEILQGLTELHSLDIVHGFLRPSCILLEKVNGAYRVFISDFGKSQQGLNFAHIFKENKISYWHPPEVKNDRPEQLSSKTDIYAFGLIAFEIWQSIEASPKSLKNPHDHSELSIIYKKNYKPKVKHALKEILRKEPSFRPTAKEIIKYPVMWKSTSIPYYFECLHNLSKRKNIELKTVTYFDWIAQVDKDLMSDVVKNLNEYLKSPLWA